MPWKRFFYNSKHRIQRFFSDQDPDFIAKALISVNLGAYFAWQVVPSFMYQNMMMGEVNTLRHHKYYTIITSAFSHDDFLPMIFNNLTIWFFAKPLAYSLGGSGVLGLYLSGAVFNFAGLYYKYKYSHRGYSLPVTQGAHASIASILTYFIIRNPWEPIYLVIFPVPAVLAGLLLLYMGSGGRDNAYLYGAGGGAFFYLLKLLRR